MHMCPKKYSGVSTPGFFRIGLLFVWGIFLSSCGRIQTSPLLHAQNRMEFPAENGKWIRQLDSVVRSYASESEFNGIIALQPDSATPVLYIHGYRNPNRTDTLLTLTDRFHIASISKQFTGLALLHAMQANGVEPTDTLGTWFPEFQPALRQVTIQQIANHTSGIPDYFFKIKQTTPIYNTDVLKFLEGIQKTDFTPGSKFSYCNSGYVIMSVLTERLSKQSFREYLSQNILAPLNLTHLEIRPDTGEMLSGYQNLTINTKFCKTTGDAGMYASALDLMHYAVRTDTLETLYQYAEACASPAKDDMLYGFGLYFGTDSIGKFRAHTGWVEGFQSYIRMYPSEKKYLILLTNKSTLTVGKVRDEVIRLMQTKIP